MNVTEALQLASVRFSAGDYSQSESICRQLLAQDARCAGALYGLGLIAHRRGQHDLAANYLQQAAALEPNSERVYSDLGLAYRSMGRWDDAAAAFRQSLAQKQTAEAHNNLGIVLQQQGLHSEAIECFHKAAQLNSDDYEALQNLANALKDAGRGDEAIAYFQQRLHFKPDAFTCYQLGLLLADEGKGDEAIALYHQAIRLAPSNAGVFNQIGIALSALRQYDAAFDCFQKALSISPDNYHAHFNIGNVLQGWGRIHEAIPHFREAIRLKSDFLLGHQCLLLALHCDSSAEPRDIYVEHLRFQKVFEQPLLSQHKPHTNKPDPSRKLKIGYVSPDFRTHPVGQYMLPLLANHDSQQFETYCYDARPALDDAVAAQLRACVHRWRGIQNLSDSQAAELIRKDQIDILVDLSLHMNNNRLLLFAHKPAPVAVTYLAYPSTSGLTSIDYRLTDSYLDPGEEPGERYYSEQSIALPCCYWCYRPPQDVPEIKALPALGEGFVNFGCLNNFAKVTPESLLLWARLLERVAGSRLLLLSWEGNHRKDVQSFFASRGIDPSRVRFASRLPQREYFALYHQIDIALDPIPYPGHTTSLDGLYMGVPSITLSGKTAVSRGGASILNHLELSELIAHSEEEYLTIAASLAGDLPRLAHLRQSLRQKMRESPIMNEKLFTASVEAAFRQMWRNWCEKR